MKFKLRLILIFSLYFYINTQESSILSKGFNIIKKIKKFSRRNIKLPNIKTITDKYFYNKTDMLKITVKNLYSKKNQIPYDYNYLDLCPLKNISRPIEGITELLTGKRMSYSNYYIFMNQNETCNLMCIKNFTSEEIEKYTWLIHRKYSATYYLDQLPSGYYKIKEDKNTKNITHSINYFSGVPIGFIQDNKYYINNHLVFYIEINEQNNKYQIVNFFISAHSAKQFSEDECINYEKNSTYFDLDDSQNTDSTDIQNRFFNVLDENLLRYYKDAELQELIPGQIAFTYDIIFIKSKKTFASRYDNYFSFGRRKKYQWGSLIISNILIYLLTLIIFFILSRTVKKDLDKYNQNITMSDNVILDEYGWKQIASDVFRPPIHQKTLSAFIGTGFEIFCLIIVSLILYLIGLIKPEIRINMIDTIFICFFVFSVISGYTSTLIYKNFGGKQWLKNTIVTALLCPIIALIVLGIVRILLSFEKSNAGFKISQMALLCFLWLFVSSPLVLVGSLLALMKNNIKYPCKVNALPTAIGKKPWYLHLQYISWIIGIIPFFTFFIEFVYLLNSLWSFNVYYLASYFSLSLLLSIVLTSEISIIYVFVNLCYGDHKWWWKSFFVSASPALYVFIYSVIYFFRTELTRFTAIVIYFLIMILISVVIGLVLGSLGTLITFRFIIYIYSKIKFD